MKNEVEQKNTTRKSNPGGLYNAYGMRILSSLRRVMRAVDIHSRRLNIEFKVTAPQMICLMALSQQNDLTLSLLAKQVNLSPSTLTGILDRLEAKALIIRERSSQDRRKVLLHLTPKGQALTEDAPILLQDRLSQAVESLPELEQATMALSLEKLIAIMDLEHLDASPNLIPGTILDDTSAQEGTHEDSNLEPRDRPI